MREGERDGERRWEASSSRAPFSSAAAAARLPSVSRTPHRASTCGGALVIRARAPPPEERSRASSFGSNVKSGGYFICSRTFSHVQMRHCVRSGQREGPAGRRQRGAHGKRGVNAERASEAEPLLPCAVRGVSGTRYQH